MKLFQSNGIEMSERVTRVSVLNFPVVCLTKEWKKTRDEISGVKLIVIIIMKSAQRDANTTRWL